MNIEEMREEFERLTKDRELGNGFSSSHAEGILERDEKGRYKIYHIQYEWDGFQMALSNYAERSYQDVAAEAYQVIGTLADGAVFDSPDVQRALDHFSLLMVGRHEEAGSILPFTVSACAGANSRAVGEILSRPITLRNDAKELYGAIFHNAEVKEHDLIFLRQ